jgi:hypothetical protein
MTWTDEEFRARGWEESEIVAFREGAASVRSWLAEMESRPAPAAEERATAAPSETEIRAMNAAALLVAQSDRLDAERRAQQLADTRVTVARPGDGPTPDEWRARALAYVHRNGTVIARPGPGNAPQAMAVQVDGEWQVVTAGAMPEVAAYGPADADKQMALWDWTAWRRDDQRLIAEFGLEECQRYGVLKTDATDAGEFTKIQLPPGVESL